MKHLPVLVIGVGLFFILTGLFAVYFSSHRLLTPAPIVLSPLKSAGILPPEISAKHVLIKDLTTGEILYAKDADVSFAPASTTKMMTALVAVSDYGWDKEITVAVRFEGALITKVLLSLLPALSPFLAPLTQEALPEIVRKRVIISR